MTRLALILCLVLAFPASAAASAPGLAPLASAAAGRAVTVTCTVPEDAPEAGYTVVGGSGIWISASACKALSHLTRSDARWLAASTDHVANVYAAGAAVQVLVHEATHLRLASGDEALVECTASRNYWQTILAFHLKPRLAQAVARAATRTHYNLTSPVYKSEC